MKTKYDFCVITRCPNMPDQWQCSGWNTGSPETMDKFRWECQQDGKKVVELGTDSRPENVEDIRGSIREQPEIVIATVEKLSGDVYYWGAKPL